jgi:hypothetical protein
MPANRKYLIKHYPHVLADWDSERNEGVDVTELFVTSKGKFWWKCQFGHHFPQEIKKRVLGNKCHVCAGFIVPGENDFFTVLPQYRAWLLLKPEEEVPDTLPVHDRHKLKWACPDKHPSFESSPRQMAHNSSEGKSPCETCRAKLRFQGKSLTDSFLDDFAEWAWDLNELGPEHHSWGSNSKEVYWACASGHPAYLATPYEKRSRTRMCPACPGSHKFVEGINDLASTHKLIADRWDFERNSLAPNQVKIGTNIKVVLKCPISPTHQTPMRLPNLKKNQLACSDCWQNPLLQGVNDLGTVGKAFVDEWDSDANREQFGVESPHQIKWTDERRFNWICIAEGHRFRQAPYARVTRGSSCTVCQNRLIQPGVNDLETWFPELAEEWCYPQNKGLLPSQIAPKSGQTVFWNCINGHEPFPSTPWNRTQAETGCPECSQYGYKDSQPGLLYLVERLDSAMGRRARKIGITNAQKGHRRLSLWKRQGFESVKIWSHESGLLIRQAEFRIKDWLVSNVPEFPYLDGDEMPTGGHTETLPPTDPSNYELIVLAERFIEECKSVR